MQDYKKLATRQIEANKPLSVIKKSIEKYLLAEDKAEWTTNKQAEYNELFPIYRDTTIEEQNEEYSSYLETTTDTPKLTENEFTFTANIKIDYSEYETYLSFNDWLNEVNVITEAVEAEYDEEGNVIVEAVEAETEMVRPYITPDNFDTEIDAYLGNTDIYKQTARTKIRAIKDSEDDLTDTKIILQWLSYAIVDIYSVLTDEQKDAMAYGDNIALFAGMIQNPDAKLRVDVEKNQLEKIQKIFADELMFANIAKTEYLDKV